jgi:hypothetical protein
MSRRVLALTVAAAAASAVVGPWVAASAKDDPAAIAKAKEAVRADLKEKKWFYYHDLSYVVDAPKLKESRWEWKDPPPFGNVTEKQGGQFYATWVDKTGAEPGITVVVSKMPHFERQGNSQSNFNYPFKSWGETVPVSKTDDMAKGFYEDWIRSATDVIKDKCSPTKKKNIGPGEYYATAVGTDPEDKKRVRKDWYVWGTTGADVPCTWVMTITIAEKFIDKEEIANKSVDLVKATKELKDKRLK